MSKPFFLGFVLGLTLLVVGGVTGARLKKQDIEQAKYQEVLAQYQREIIDATPTQFGEVAERQRIHSKLYTYYQPLTNNGTISDLIKKDAKSMIVEIVVHVGLGEALTGPETPEDYFGKLAKASDTVIRGRAIKKISRITEDETFIFTDYEVVVTEVFKNNLADPLDIGAIISVTRPGGKVVVDGVIVKVKDNSFAPLPINDKDVVLFLKFIPETGAYQATRTTGSFELDGSILRPLTGVQFPLGVIQDGTSFLRTTRAILNK
jgi:hypothetical protein